MSLFSTGMNLMSKRLPKVIDPKTHAVIDYGIAGLFLIAGAIYWKRNKRAAVSAFICGGATAMNAMLTDYPGGVWKEMSYQTHGKVDAGLVGATGSMPRLMDFDDDDEARFFKMQTMVQATVTAMTDFDALGKSARSLRADDVA
jgi:hypothetical protein